MSLSDGPPSRTSSTSEQQSGRGSGEIKNGDQKFDLAWKNAVADPLMVEYARSKIPTSVQSKMGFDSQEDFGDEPTTMGHFLYDAILSMGYAMCESNKTFFNGADLVPLVKTLDFNGASGHVKYNEFGSREGGTVVFQIWNAQDRSSESISGDGTDNELVDFTLVPTCYFESGSWQPIQENHFVYADGTTNRPNELPDLHVDENIVSDVRLSFGYALRTAAMLFSICSILWTLYFRAKAVIIASQSEFLILLCMGSFISASTILPLSFQGRRSHDSVNVACMAMPWLFFVGFSITYGTLFAKTLCINKVRLCACSYFMPSQSLNFGSLNFNFPDS